ncbi:protein SIEVE ELEMENT OCCLUSION C isoform X2 [Gossypium raimondii]|uniref:protein SIEVE ELEMENT OCCLUSION C isoform X2 n=1 Tax=Gossypium raimondii TaxID=29730 RepID=UPI00227ADBD3|nr:protein SIEVE ELEMENT OCCLUSION C isoform X2 [Gossypium raimondii]
MTSVQSGSFWQHSQSYLDDEILIKKLLLSHDPDRRRLNSEMLLSAVENIVFHATASEELMLCKSPGEEDLHTRTMASLDLLGSHRWGAKAALALAAFAISYGEFSLLMQLRPHIPLAVSIANFKQIPSNMSMLKPQVRALRSLSKTMVDLTKCIIEFEALPLVHVGPDMEDLAVMKPKIYVTAYWIIRSTLVCSSQIKSLMAMKPEQVYSNITIAAWELLSLDNRLSSIYSHLRPQVDAFRRQTEAKMHQKLLSLFKKSHIDNQNVLQMLFALKDDLPLKDCSTQEKLGVSALKSKVVLLLISKPDLLPFEQLFFLVNQTYDHPHNDKIEGSYAIIWVPISFYEAWTDAEQKLFDFISNSMPCYLVRQPWSLNSAVVNFMKQEWNYGGEAIMVVLDSEGMITNLNALDMVFIWGSKAYPFSLSRENELWDGEQWKMQLITNEIHPILTQWVEEGRNICIYGSENLDWIREFNAKMKDIKDAGMQHEMIYVGKNNPGEHTKEILSIMNREIHSNLLSFTKIQLFWLRLESMRRSKSRLGNNASTDNVVAQVSALLDNNNDNGWAVYGKGLSTDIVRVEGDEIFRCLNLFRQWGENVGRLEFIDALRTVLEPPLVDGPCNHTQVVPYSEGLVQGNMVCQNCKLLMKKFTIYE